MSLKSLVLSGAKFRTSIGFAAVTLLSILSLTGCGGSSKPLSVQVTAAASTVDGTDTTTLSATVAQDKNAAGVTWSVSGGGTLSGQTTTSATYTAPAATSSAQTVTVTATSVAEPAKTGTATITVAAAPTVTTASSDLAGAVGTAYSVQLKGSGGIAPYKNWALAAGSGALPACLTLSSAGVLTTASGTVPTASCAGTYANLIFTYTDSGTPNALTATSQPLSLTITAPTITFAPSLGAGAVGTAYAGSVAATGALGATSYSLASGSLGADLTLNTSSGTITGTPKASDAGTFTFTVKVVDLYGDTATSGTLSITIAAAQAITFTTTSLAAGTYQVSYSASVAAGGGAGTLTYTESGALAAGLILSSAGMITGIPTAVGTFPITVMAADGYGDSNTHSYSIVVSYPALTVTAATLPAGYVDYGYSAQLQATGGAGVTGNYTFALSGGTSLPAGLSLSSSGAISGKPSGSGATSFQVTATDTVAGLTSAAQSFSITVNAITVSISSPSGSPTLVTGATQAISATTNDPAGVSSLMWTVSAGCGSLTAATGSSNTYTAPTSLTTACTAMVTVTSATDSSVTATVTITVNPITVSITSPSGSTATTTSGSAALAITAATNDPAGTSTLTWTVGTGCGTLSAATGASNTYTPPLTLAAQCLATVTVTSSTDPTKKATLVITVNPATITLTLTAPASTTPSVSESGTLAVGANLYNDVGTSTGITYTLTPVAPAVSCGSFSGMTLQGTSGATTSYSGTYTAPATACSAALTLASAGNPSATATLTITVVPGIAVTLNPAGPVSIDANNALSITPTVLNDSANKGVNLSISPATGCGTLSATSAASGTAFNYNPPAITSGSCQAGVTATSQSDTTKSATLNITVYPSLSLPATNPTSLPSTGTTGVGYTGSISVSGGSGSYSWTVTGLSDNLTSSPSGGTVNIGGTPTSATTVTFSAKVTDTTTGFSVTQTGYTITVSNPPPLTLPSTNPSTLGSATVNQLYGGTITVTGGTGPYTWKINNVQVNGGSVALSNNLTATVGGTGSNTLSVGGTPTTTTSVPISSVTVTDSEASPVTAGPISYSIAVNSAGSQVGGQIYLNNFCGGSSPTLPTITVNLYTSPGATLVQTTTTDGSGNYLFPNPVANGTYTITPSITGASSVFYPATQSVPVNSGDMLSENFSVALGYTVSGTVTAGTGVGAGQIYLNLINNNCGGSGGEGTSISAPGTYTIHGVPPGSYTLSVWEDPTALGDGALNVTDATGSLSPVTVSASGLTGQDVQINNPTLSAPTETPKLKSIEPTNLGMVISYGSGSVTNNNGVEVFTSYTVEASTSSSFSSAITATYNATGRNANIWLVDNAVAGISGSFSNSTAYYVRVMGTSPAGNSSWVYWAGPGVSCTSSSCATTVTVGAPTTGNEVTGTVIIPSGITVSGPLYMGVYDQANNIAYGTYVQSPVTGSTGNSFTVYVPNGTNYFEFGILDQNKDGMIDAGDVTNTNIKSSSSITVNNGSVSLPNLTLPDVNSDATVQTQFYQDTYWNGSSSQTSTGYSLNMTVRQDNQLPVAVQLASASNPNVITPVDISSYCQGCGSVQFQIGTGLGPDVPAVGDTYTFNVTYGNGTTGTVVGTVTGWNGTSTLVGASDLATNLAPQQTNSTSTTPTFTWTYPSSASNYVYQFNVCCDSNGTIWQIPSNNSNSNGFTSAQIPMPAGIAWPTDPTDSTNAPSVSGLTLNTNYNWSIQVKDSNSNSAQNTVWYQP